MCLLLATKTVAVPGAFFLSQLAASLDNKSSASAVNGPTSVGASQLDLLQHPNLDMLLAWYSQIFKKSTSLTFFNLLSLLHTSADLLLFSAS